MDDSACEWIIKSDKAKWICGDLETTDRRRPGRTPGACSNSRYVVVDELTMVFTSDPIILK
jgi:hypothetical protein